MTRSTSRRARGLLLSLLATTSLAFAGEWTSWRPTNDEDVEWRQKHNGSMVIAQLRHDFAHRTWVNYTVHYTNDSGQARSRDGGAYLFPGRQHSCGGPFGRGVRTVVIREARRE